MPSERIDHRFTGCLAACHAVLEGYMSPVVPALDGLVACLDSPALAVLQWEEEVAVVRARLPGGLVETLEGLLEEHKAEVEAHEAALALGGMGGPIMAVHEFPAAQLLAAVEAALEACPASERGQLAGAVEPLTRLAKRHSGGREGYCVHVVVELLERFLEVEECFRLGGAAGPTTEQEAVEALRKVRDGARDCVARGAEEG